MQFLEIYSQYNIKNMLFFSIIFISAFVFFIWLKIHLFSTVYKFKEDGEEKARFVSGLANLFFGEILFLVIIPIWTSFQAVTPSFILTNIFIGIAYLLLLSFFEYVFTKKLLLEESGKLKAFFAYILINLLLGGIIILIFVVLLATHIL